MSIDEGELQRLRAAFAARSGERAEGCPTPEILWDARRGELPAERRRDVVEHLAGCASCAEDWRLARELEQSRPGTVVPSASRFRPTVGWLAAAAALALVIGGIWWRGGPVEPGFREAADEEIRTLVPETEALDRGRVVLRWSPGPAGTRYVLRVSSERLEPIAAAVDLERPEFHVPEEALARVPANGRIFWQVEATRPGGRRVTSKTFVTTVR